MRRHDPGEATVIYSRYCRTVFEYNVGMPEKYGSAKRSPRREGSFCSLASLGLVRIAEMMQDVDYGMREKKIIGEISGSLRKQAQYACMAWCL